jgi:hypothetical protein
MGRPAWANDDQWTWLKSQATEYLKIKGKKKETAKFWPGFLDAWQEQWPKPALSDLVRDDGARKDLATAETGDGVGANNLVHNEGNGASANSSAVENTDKTGLDETDTDANAGGKQQSASKKKKKERKPLTVSVVRTT